jgi:plasmid stabilization system protein ParE
MAYEARFPPDTHNEIDAFVASIGGEEKQRAAADALDEEVAKLLANPMLGAVQYGGPFESRRIHRAVIRVGGSVRTVEFVYRVVPEEQYVVLSGFREVLPPPVL